MNECEIENTKSKVVRLDPETVWFLEKYKKERGIVHQEILSDAQNIKSALVECLTKQNIDNAIKK